MEAVDGYTIEQFGLVQAGRLRIAFAKTLQRLLRLPRSGRVLPELAPDERELRAISVQRTFVVAYQVTPKDLRVDRVLHGARDLPFELRTDSGLD
ncbi:MAG: type II toxin-antitoxin system RelE/ParE family toxin [Planctomycetes bacterium]|nr:type II toxin-antitoxin system RelE/ParE family toxin [Planctomycetota bacterium]